MKAIMSKEIREAIRDPKKSAELQQAIADFVSKRGTLDEPTISFGGKTYKIVTPETRW